MITPTMARRALTARSSTAERESPRSYARTGGPLVFENASMRFADCVVFVRAHGAFAQPQHVAAFIVQGNGMGARGLDGRTHLLADGIEIDERTVRRAEGFAVLHRSATLRVERPYLPYRRRPWCDGLRQNATVGACRCVAGVTYHRYPFRTCGYTW